LIFSDVDIIFLFYLIIALCALISVFLLIYFCSMVASSNRLTNNAVRFALDRQRIEQFSYYFVCDKAKILFLCWMYRGNWSCHRADDGGGGGGRRQRKVLAADVIVTPLQPAHLRKSAGLAVEQTILYIF